MFSKIIQEDFRKKSMSTKTGGDERSAERRKKDSGRVL